VVERARAASSVRCLIAFTLVVQAFASALQIAQVGIRLPIEAADGVVAGGAHARDVVGFVGTGPGVGDGDAGADEEAFVGVGFAVEAADGVVVHGADAGIVNGLTFTWVIEADPGTFKEALVGVGLVVSAADWVVA